MLPAPLLAFLEAMPDAAVVLDEYEAVVWSNGVKLDADPEFISELRVPFGEYVVVMAREIPGLGRDPLTGLRDRRVLMEHLDQAVAAARRGRPALLLYMDLDQLKAVNDTEGHAGGDRHLRQFAATLESVVRAEDVVARMGGDEFAVLMRNVHRDHVETIADAARQRLAPAASVGFACVDGTLSAAAVLDRADRSCYEQKQLRSETADPSA